VWDDPTRVWSVGLVAIDGLASAAAPMFELTRTLKAAGVTVIGYADGLDRCPLAVRCRALLEGCALLLDSAKPDFLHLVDQSLRDALKRDAEMHRQESDLSTTMRHLGILGDSAAVRRAVRWTQQVSSLSDLPALITGESGTGKQLLAEALHRLDPKRGNGPFVAVNCGAISAGIAESELFGHRRGSFTGADRDRRGLFRAAHGGVLFLDEVGELELPLQSKLLRVLQENRVLAVGDEQEVPISVRIVAATNQDLSDLVDRKLFRADLFHRLNVLALHVPPLRERRSDIRVLVEHFLVKHAAFRASPPHAAGTDFVDALTQAELPGNARELENLVKRALATKEGTGPLQLQDLPSEILQQLSARAHASESSASRKPASRSIRELLDGNGWNLSRSLRACERALVAEALGETRGNQTETARLLGITPRSVYNKLRKHQLHA
jgi:two-component system response regulator PilR (NtrC family)